MLRGKDGLLECLDPFVLRLLGIAAECVNFARDDEFELIWMFRVGGCRFYLCAKVQVDLTGWEVGFVA